MSIIGALAGLVTALVIAAFLVGIEYCKQLFLSVGSSEPSQYSILQSAMGNPGEDFETLAMLPRFLLVLGIAVLLGVIYHNIQKGNRYTGLNHTLITLHEDQARFPLKNFLLQFFGGILALAGGQSGGREGPGIHLGAASSTLIASRFHLPHNSLRTLTACGTAAAIAAGFNTPIAGVIFAMEVIVMEYTVIGFLPVILAAVTATLVSNAIFGSSSIFEIQSLQINWITELPFMLCLSLLCALAAVAFIKIQQWSQPIVRLPVLWRFSIAGLVTALIGIQFPEVLGMGFDTIHGLMQESMIAWVLVSLCALKIIATALSSAVGMPIGIIGPSIFIGATLGAATGQIAAMALPGQVSSEQFYALLAMGGVMSALLNAPLAGVIAVMELAGTNDVLLPGIIVIVVANLAASEFFQQRSANEILLQSKGIELDTIPVTQALNRIGLSKISDNDNSLVSNLAQLTAVTALPVEQRRKNLVIQCESDDGGDQQFWLLPREAAEDCLQLLNTSLTTQPELALQSADVLAAIKTASFNAIQLLPIDIVCTLDEARQLLKQCSMQGLYVKDHYGPFRGTITKSELLAFIETQ